MEKEEAMEATAATAGPEERGGVVDLPVAWVELETVVVVEATSKVEEVDAEMEVVV